MVTVWLLAVPSELLAVQKYGSPSSVASTPFTIGNISSLRTPSMGMIYILGTGVLPRNQDKVPSPLQFIMRVEFIPVSVMLYTTIVRSLGVTVAIGNAGSSRNNYII